MLNAPKFTAKQKIAVVLNDAGATNIAMAWLKNIEAQVRPFVTGPAALMWEEEFPDTKLNNIEDALTEVNLVLTGTGFGSEAEHHARKTAKKHKIFSVGIIDHWTNYQNRFTFQSEEVLPDEIWVTDEFARKQAKSFFPTSRIKIFENSYLINKVNLVKAHANEAKLNSKTIILYLLEPINETWAKESSAEIEALNYFADNIDCLIAANKAKIKLRPHPSEPLNKYTSWVAQKTNLDAEIETEVSLEKQIAEADFIVGCNTFAMIIAFEAGKRVICSIPPWGPRSKLKTINLEYLSTLSKKRR